MKLYELSTAMEDIYAKVLDEEANLDALEDTLQCIEASVEEKTENGIKLLRSLQSFANAVKAERDFQDKRYKSLDNRIKRIKAYYLDNLLRMGKDKIQTNVGTMAAQDSTASLKIFNEAALPPQYLIVVPARYELDKEKIKADLKAGIEIPGACLEQGKHLRIR